MCVYVEPEVILANLLTYNKSDEGISIEDLDKYCQGIKRAIKDDVYCHFNSNDLEITLIRYSDEFKRFQNKFFINNKININHFNTRYTVEIANVLKNVALNFGR